MKNVSQLFQKHSVSATNSTYACKRGIIVQEAFYVMFLQQSFPVCGGQYFFLFLFRHNSYIQECTGHLEPTYHASIHDLRLLLQRFAFEKSFSEDTGGGGRDSNIKFVPYAIHMILYVLNT